MTNIDVIPAAFLSGNPQLNKTGFLPDTCRNDKHKRTGYKEYNEISSIIKILIADDEESMRFFLSELLKKEGYLFETAVDGEDALSKIKASSFDIAILDLKMPKLSGMELLSEIKKVSPDTVVIIITAHGTRNIAIEAIEKGAYDYFTKPFDVNEM